jgi:hypothetical protein
LRAETRRVGVNWRSETQSLEVVKVTGGDMRVTASDGAQAQALRIAAMVGRARDWATSILGITSCAQRGVPAAAPGTLLRNVVAPTVTGAGSGSDAPTTDHPLSSTAWTAHRKVTHPLSGAVVG